MKITKTLAVAIGLAALAACKQTPQENAAEICSAGACVPCSLAGFIEMGDPRTCCRGLDTCPASNMFPPKCVTPGSACP